MNNFKNLLAYLGIALSILLSAPVDARGGNAQYLDNMRRLQNEWNAKAAQSSCDLKLARGWLEEAYGICTSSLKWTASREGFLLDVGAYNIVMPNMSNSRATHFVVDWECNTLLKNWNSWSGKNTYAPFHK